MINYFRLLHLDFAGSPPGRGGSEKGVGVRKVNASGILTYHVVAGRMYAAALAVKSRLYINTFDE